MDKIAGKLKAYIAGLRAKLSDLKGKLRDCPRRVLYSASVGLFAVCLVAGAVIYTGVRDADKDMDLRSPKYEPQVVPEQFNPEDKPVYTVDDGVVVIPAAITDVSTPLAAMAAAGGNTDAIWAADKVVTYNSFTVQEKVKQADGSLGVLNIPKIGLSANVYQADPEMESMTKGIAHFGYTSIWDGNIGLCSHNINFDLSDGHFKNLYKLQKGDEVRFSTELGERVYAVSVVREISDTDWSGLGRTPDNRISMITCITGKPDMRLLVQAVENR